MQTKISNLFQEKTESELCQLYEQFLEFEKEGNLSSETELGKIRDRYCHMYGSVPLVCMERDLLHAIANQWHSKIS